MEAADSASHGPAQRSETHEFYSIELQIYYFFYQSISVLNVKENIQRPVQQVHHTKIHEIAVPPN